jgi:hypothetical protein
MNGSRAPGDAGGCNQWPSYGLFLRDHEEVLVVSTSTKPSPRKTSARTKVEHPAKVYSEPKEVVADSSLSAQEKRVVLDTMEQDARQLATASAEGMSGGEETKLHGVLQAKRALEPPSVDAAFRVVLRAFEQQLRETLGTDTHAVITRAIDAINAAREAMAGRVNAPTPPPGAPLPGSREELREELDKEKLDPGG